MPYFMKHYSQFASVVVLENNSTDKTVQIAKSWGARVWEQDIPDVIDDQWYIDIKDNIWKSSKADWVMVVDCDEFIYHPNLVEVLEQTSGTIIEPTFYEMFSEKFPTTETQIYDEVKFGCDGGPKINIFRPGKIKEINYQGGCHNATPLGDVQFAKNTGICTLHMRFLSLQYVLDRSKHSAQRLSEFNKRTGLGFHYLWSEEDITNHFKGHLAKSTQVIL